MKILKRNQIIISVLALMLITVGYMSFTSNMTSTLEAGALMDAENVAGIGDAKLVNSDNAMEEERNNSNTTSEADLENSKEEKNITEEKNKTSNEIKNEKEENVGSAVSTSSGNVSGSTSANSVTTKSQSDYFVTSRLEREKMYSQMLETYQGILESSTISPEQKNISTQEIANINNQKNSIMIAENLIKNLGFEDVVIFVNYNSTSVIIKAGSLQDSDVAQIQNIVCREIGVDVETIHISLK